MMMTELKKKSTHQIIVIFQFCSQRFAHISAHIRMWRADSFSIRIITRILILRLILFIFYASAAVIAIAIVSTIEEKKRENKLIQFYLVPSIINFTKRYSGCLSRITTSG
jgi:hypothetical protein